MVKEEELVSGVWYETESRGIWGAFSIRPGKKFYRNNIGVSCTLMYDGRKSFNCNVLIFRNSERFRVCDIASAELLNHEYEAYIGDT